MKITKIEGLLSPAPEFCKGIRLRQLQSQQQSHIGEADFSNILSLPFSGGIFML
jgi:hypothetical protein